MRTRSRACVALVLGLVALVGTFRAVDPAGSTPTPSAVAPAPTTETTSVPTTALTAAHLLPVQGRAPRTGYDRDLFGQTWADVDRNGCDTRNDILRRDLDARVLKDGTHGCVVASGTLRDPYSGETIAFVRGQGTSTAVQIDHVVALADAWQKGAQQWEASTREAFANDPLNLLAVDGPLNQQKGAGDTATWLPPHKAFRCAYVARQVAVKHAYGLGVTQAEQDAMVRVLSACPTEPLPS
ncbi:HNH endonuclease family protein [uncultured Cellulomonas sp.]|uniref:HNH endonuclease family protein n=1 Tax=uncultured Cellulomonas sp. TaxID=189682 RepID=UPI0028E9F3E6|nr:HNH endonuclease family protein [uncultured Cellulomonas sp.]